MRIAAALALAVLALGSTGAAGQGQGRFSPRDLEGMWEFATLTPLERSAEFAAEPFLTDEQAAAYVRQTIERGDRDRRDGGAAVDVGRAVNDYWFDRGTALSTLDGRPMASLIVDPPDGRLPALTAAARKDQADRAREAREHPADGPENRSLQERCLAFNAGPPILPGPYNNLVKILQFTGQIVIFTEMIHDARIVPLDGRPHPPAGVRLWLGDSRGRWEGNALVIETTNFTSKTAFRGADEHLRLVERLERTGAETLLYEFTVEDPTVFSRPWTAHLPMTKTDARMYEYACHEANYAIVDILRGARFQER